MDFEDSSHRDLRRYLEGNEDQLVDTVESFYADIRGILRQGLDSLESEVNATIEPPNVCVFAPVELVRDDIGNVRITDYDYDLGREIGEGEFLLAMSLFLGYRYGHDFDEASLYRGLFQRFYEEHLHGEDNYWIPKVMYYLGKRDFHEPHARFYQDYRSIVVNSFLDAGIEKSDVPKILEPMYSYMSRKPGDPRAATLHEMTHLYIHEKSKFRKKTGEVAAIDEAAAQSVSNVVNSEKVPSSIYYDGPIDREVMQAARQVFNESTSGMDWSKAVSTIRREAVRAIDDVVDGEDPIRALREEDEFRSRIVRIASYTIERTEREVVKDVRSVGFYSEALEDKLDEVDDDIVSRPEVLRTFHSLGRSAEYLEERAEEGEIREELVEETVEVASKASRLGSLVLDRRQSSGPEIEELNGVDITEQIFGDPDWTDPAFPRGDRELEEFLLTLLDSYGFLVDETYEAAGEIEKRAEKLEERLKALLERYEDERAASSAETLIESTQEIIKEMESSRKNLEEVEEMIEVAEKRIKDLEPGDDSWKEKWKDFMGKMGF